MGIRAGTVKKSSGFLRKCIVFCVVVAAGAGIAAVAIPFLVDLNRYKGFITGKIEQAINKKVELKDIRLNLIGGVGLDVAGCTITAPGGADIFTCENLSVRLKVLPLLAKRIEVARIEIRAPRVRIVRDVRGNLNFMPEKTPSSPAAQPTAKKTAASAQKGAPGGKKKTAEAKKPPAAQMPVERTTTAGAPAASSVPAKGPSSKPFAVEVESVQIVNGMISYRDETKKNPREISVSDLSLSVKGLQEGGDLRCKLSGTLHNTGKVKLQAAVGKVPQGFDFGGALDTLKGTLDVSFKGVDATDLIEIARDYARELPLIKGVFDADLSVKGSLRELALNVSADLKRCEFAYQDLFAKAKDTPCSLQCKAQWKKAGNVKVDVFSLVFGDSKVQAEGQAEWASPLQLKMTGNCDLSLKDCAAVKSLKALRPEGKVRLDLSVQTKGDGINLDALKKSGRAALVKEMGDADFTLKCAIKDFDAGLLTRIQKGPVQYAGPASLDFEARGSVQDMRLTGKADLDKVSIEYPVLFAKPAGKQLVSDFNVSVKGMETISIETFDFRFGSSKCKASGVIKNIDTLEMDMKLASRVAMSDLGGIKDVKSYGFSGGLDAAIDIKGTVRDLRDMAVNGYIDIDHVKFKPPALNRGDVEIDGALKINKDVYDLQGLLVNIGSSRLTVHGKIRNIDSPTGTFDVAVERLDVNEMLKLVAEGEKAGKKQPETPKAKPREKSVPVPKSGSAEVVKQPVLETGSEKSIKAVPPEAYTASGKEYLDRIDIQGKISIKELLFKQNIIRDVKTNIVMKDGTLSLKEFSLKGFDGTVQGAATYRMTGAVKAFDTTVAMKDVDINQALTANTNLKDRILGKLDLDLQLAGKGATTEVMKKQMKGKGVVDIRNGKLISIDILRNLSSISGIIGLDLPNIDDTEFRKLGMTLDIQNGACTTNDLEMLTDYFDMKGAGYFTFDALIDMGLNVLLTKEFTARLGGGDLQQAMTGADGRMSIPFTVKGPLEKPKFSPNWGDILTRQAQYKLQKMIGDKLFKKEEGQAAPAGQTEQAAPPAAQQQPAEQKSKGEILADVLIDVFSESMKKQQKPSGQQ